MDLTQGIWPWLLFNGFVLVMLALDLGVFNRKSHTVSLKEATIWSVAWISLALLFNAGLYYFQGADTGTTFLTGYLIEKSLSVDNLFVFVLLFKFFKVPSQYQHRVLFWGILGALLMRGALIAVGSTMIERFHWIIYIFGLFLVYTGIRIAFQKNEEVDPEKNPVLKLAKRVLPLTSEYHDDRFMIKENGKRVFTPLLLALIVVETTDVIFAVDSIPAIFAVTTDAFIVYTSNVFAILGLRSLYFVFANIVDKFYCLKYALAVILTFVGIKMLVSDIFHLPTFIPLIFIALTLIIAIVASVLRARRGGGKEQQDKDREEESSERKEVNSKAQ